MVCNFLMIAAAPRPLRLRRRFEVTTAPLNSLSAIRITDFICSATQHRNVIILCTINSYDLYYIYLFKIICIQEIRNKTNKNKKIYLFFSFFEGQCHRLNSRCTAYSGVFFIVSDVQITNSATASSILS